MIYNALIVLLYICSNAFIFCTIAQKNALTLLVSLKKPHGLNVGPGPYRNAAFLDSVKQLSSIQLEHQIHLSKILWTSIYFKLLKSAFLDQKEKGYHYKAILFSFAIEKTTHVQTGLIILAVHIVFVLPYKYLIENTRVFTILVFKKNSKPLVVSFQQLIVL